MKKLVLCFVIVVLAVSALILPAFASVDWTQYTSSNLLPLPYYDGYTAPGQSYISNGVTYTVLDDGRIRCVGTASGRSLFRLSYNYNFQGLYQGVFFCRFGNSSSAPSGVECLADVNNGQGVWLQHWQPNTILSNLSSYYLTFFIAIASGTSVDIIITPSVTEGVFAYQPYIPYYIGQSYEGESGYFATSTYTADLYFSDNTVGHVSVAPDFTFGGVYFQSFYNFLDANYDLENDIDTVVINITPSVPVDWVAYPIAISGDSDVSYADVLTDNGSYGVEADGGSERLRFFEFLNEPSAYPVLMTRFSLRVGRPYDLLTAFTLYSSSADYVRGYNKGYTEGERFGNVAEYERGVAAGDDVGYRRGYAEGVEFAREGSFYSLITAVIEVPVNTFQSMLDFEILGVNMKDAVLALLTLCLVVTIVKKVVL